MAELRGSSGDAPNHIITRWFGTPNLHTLDVYESKAGGYKALRKALLAHFPAIRGVHLIDYKVRVINSKDETSAAVRVVIECRRDKADATSEIFGTIGVSENIIDASWQALVDAYEYHLIHEQERATPVS